jgi:glucose-6-phosphate isomerase
MLIALFERAVGFYASLVNINAYHQPGVEDGKKAAAVVLNTQGRVMALLGERGQKMSVDQITKELGDPSSAETIFKILRHLAANNRVAVSAGKTIFDDLYSIG